MICRSDTTETLCKTCASVRNCINGRWCTVKRKYVEYNTIRECNEYKQGTNTGAMA